MKKKHVFSCVIYVASFFSFLYWVIGIFIILTMIWTFNNPMFLLILNRSGEIFHIISYSIVFVGCLILLSGCLGSYGIFKKSKPILFVFILSIIIIVSSKIAMVTWIRQNTDRLYDIIRASIKLSIQEEYGQKSTITVNFDYIQKNFKCCGADAPSDWMASQYNNVGREDIINMAFSSLNAFFNIPESCCNVYASETPCEISRYHKIGAVTYFGVHKKGCTRILAEMLSNNFNLMFAVIISVFLFELITIVSSTILFLMIPKNSNRSRTCNQYQ